jgi:hypothetical protein
MLAGWPVAVQTFSLVPADGVEETNESGAGRDAGLWTISVSVSTGGAADRQAMVLTERRTVGAAGDGMEDGCESGAICILLAALATKFLKKKIQYLLKKSGKNPKLFDKFKINFSSINQSIKYILWS